MGEYLSDVINLNEIKKEGFNVIKAPTGCGKTTFCLEKLSKLISNGKKMLYLCPTTDTKEQILRNPNCRQYCNALDGVNSYEGFNNIRDCGESIIVMTYEQLGSIVSSILKAINKAKSREDRNRIWDYKDYFYDYCFDIIVCDEFHDYDWRMAAEIKKGTTDFIRTAFDFIKEMIESEIYVVGISATPNGFLTKWAEKKHCINLIEKDNKNWEIIVGESRKSGNLNLAVRSIAGASKVIFYISRISEMLKIKKIAEEIGFKPLCLWSVNNTGHPMNQEQLAARKYIIETGKFPEDYDFLIINKSYEMGLNIKTEVEVMIIGSSKEDTIIQVLGRTRQSYLPLLITYSSESNDSIDSIIEDYIGIELDKEKKNELCDLIVAKRQGGNKKAGWTTIKKILVEQGFKVEDRHKRVGNSTTRYSIISR